MKIKSTIKHCNASCMMSNTCGILQERNKNGEYELKKNTLQVSIFNSKHACLEKKRNKGK